MDENFEKLVGEASNILENQENYQWRLGELSQQIVEKYGYKALEDFSKQIQENCGVKRTPGSLRTYAYVWKISSKLELPKDILFSTCMTITFSGNPPKYAQMAREGASRIDILKSVNEDKYAQNQES